MIAWDHIVMQHDHRIFIGYGKDKDSCDGRLRYDTDNNNLKILRNPKGMSQAVSQKIANAIQQQAMDNELSWQETCLFLHSLY